MWKWLVGGFLGCVLLCGGGGAALYFTGQVDKAIERFKPQKFATSVRVEPAERGRLVRTVSAPGTIRPLTMVEISAQVSSQVLELPFRERDTVKKGDVIVRLDDEELTASLESAQANLRAQEAQLEGVQATVARAEASFNRIQNLHGSGDRSDADLEAARADYLNAQSSMQATTAGIEAAKANVRRAERDLRNGLITSPIDGTIVRIDVEVGETVLGTFNNQGSRIMQIANMSEMVLYAQVDESTVAPIESGQNSIVYLISHPEMEFSGTVQGVKLERQTTSDGTGIFETEILLDVPEQNVFRVGMTANTDIEVEVLEDVIRVPSQAVLDRRVEDLPEDIKSSEHIDPEKTFARVVYRVADGKAIATPVSVGPSDLTHTAVLGGLEPETDVITGPYKVLVALSHDQEVKIETEESDEERGGEGEDDGDVDVADSGGDESDVESDEDSTES